MIIGECGSLDLPALIEPALYRLVQGPLKKRTDGRICGNDKVHVPRCEGANPSNEGDEKVEFRNYRSLDKS